MNVSFPVYRRRSLVSFAHPTGSGMDMTSVLIIVICLTVSVAAFLFRRLWLELVYAIVAGVLEFKAGLKEIDDELWRR